MDADDVLERGSRPAAPPFNYGVTPGPWVCLNADRLCAPILASPAVFGLYWAGCRPVVGRVSAGCRPVFGRYLAGIQPCAFPCRCALRVSFEFFRLDEVVFV